MPISSPVRILFLKNLTCLFSFFCFCLDFFKSNLSFRWRGHRSLRCTSGLETRFMRCYAFNKRTDQRITYTKEVGEKLQGSGRGVVNIPPIVGWHAGWTVLWRPVVQEVGQQLGCPPCAVETLVENSSEHWIRQQSLI